MDWLELANRFIQWARRRIAFVREWIDAYRERKLVPADAYDGPRNHKAASFLLERGRRYYNDKKYEKAEHYFRKAVQHDKGYAKAYYYLGLALFQREKLQPAISAWNRVIEADPESELATKARRKIAHIRGETEPIAEVPLEDTH